MKILLRNEAIKQNSVRYFTAKPCKRGHVAERHTVNGTCVVCSNDERHKKCVKNWRNSHPEETKSYRRGYHSRNPEKDNAYSKRWHEKNKEHAKNYGREYYKKNVEHVKAYRKGYVAKNLDKFRAYANNRRSKIESVGGKHTNNDIEKIKKLQKYKCAYCPKSVRKKYHVDHIIALSKGGSNDRKNLQVTCESCNLKKRNKDPITYAQELGKLI